MGSVPSGQLEPLGYHVRLRDTLKELEPGLWKWFASDKFTQQLADQVEVELLKNSYRLPRAAHAELYQTANDVANMLGIDAEIRLYQAEGAASMNAGLLFLPGRVELLLQGPILKHLAPQEMRALLGHELAHYRLWSSDEGSFLVMNELLEYIASDPRASDAHVHTARRNRRWLELYADRGSLLASGDLHASVACLVKVGTGLETVDPEAYLSQAEEITSRSDTGSDGETHPETFIRALALRHWAEGKAKDDSTIARLVEGPFSVRQLDLMQQRQLTKLTHQLVERILGHDWFRTDGVISQAAEYFPNTKFERDVATPQVPQGADPSTLDYLSYVLLDFATSDEDLGEAAIVYAGRVADELGLQDHFRKIAQKELKLSAKAWRELQERADGLLEGAETRTGTRA